MLLSSEYLQKLHDSLATHVDKDFVAKRYDFLSNQIQGSDVAQTPSCWLNYSVYNVGQRYDTVLATDEFFTYATEQTQQGLIQQVVGAVKKRLIITVRDFKNTSRHDLALNFNFNQENASLIVTENTKGVPEDRQAWQQDTYLVEHKINQEPTVIHVGPVHRRAVYFKQMAKFCFDAGCKTFQVVPNILFKPPFKRHAEHVVVVDW